MFYVPHEKAWYWRRVLFFFYWCHWRCGGGNFLLPTLLSARRVTSAFFRSGIFAIMAAPLVTAIELAAVSRTVSNLTRGIHRQVFEWSGGNDGPRACGPPVSLYLA